MTAERDTWSDRKLMIIIVGVIGLGALVGNIIMNWRIIDALNDARITGTELAVICQTAGALLAIVTGVIGWFAPSPLSKSTTTDDPTTVVVANTPIDPVPITEGAPS